LGGYQHTPIDFFRNPISHPSLWVPLSLKKKFPQRDEAGKITKKIVSKVQVTTEKQRVSKRVEERKKWKKFGSALRDNAEETFFTIYGEPFALEMKRRSANHYTEEDEDDSKLKNQICTQKKSVVVCTFCGEQGHFSLRCPKRSLIGGNSKPSEDSGPGSRSSGPPGRPGRYVPIHMRGDRAGMGFQREKEHSLKVSNISEEATEDDLRDLFRRCGDTRSVYLARDKHTGRPRGFAYVRYAREEDAMKAIEMLDGYGYGNLILSVEKAKPREPRKDDGKDRRKF